MRRREDNWINATHILKAAGFDKPARTRILERDVQKDVHEKIQGGYGKYQGSSCRPLFVCPALTCWPSRNMDSPRTRRGTRPSQQYLRPVTAHLRVPARKREPPACPKTRQQAQGAKSPPGRPQMGQQVARPKGQPAASSRFPTPASPSRRHARRV